MGFCHERTVGEETWLTPRFIINAIQSVRMPDVDPCSPMTRPWDTATRHFNKVKDGFNRWWNPKDFYWVNPPYGKECDQWLNKTAEHGNALALIFARTETQMFHRSIWEHPNATAVLFFKGRLKFATIDGESVGTAGAPSVLVAYGEGARDMLVRLVGEGKLKGRIILLNEGQAGVYRLGVSA
ncbi:adenine methyltransferase [Bacillus sp. NP157]|nr:adenine methyltransferase [Bacillus sp. NP157]